MLFLAGAAGLVAGAWLSTGEPRFAWHNTTLVVDYARTRWLSALAAALGACLAAWTAPRWWIRLALLGVAAAAAGIGLHRGLYRLEADSVSLVQRGIFGTDRVAWKDVSRVESGPAVAVVWGAPDRQVRIRTGDLLAEDRAILDRTVARRVREANPPR